MVRPPRTFVAVVAAVGLLGLAACGDTTADTADADADAPAVDCAATPGETVTVDIGDFVFDPTPVRVSACDSVVWTNVHTQAHTSTGQGDKAWSSGNIQPDEPSEPVLFEAPGEFAYICALHPFMEGTVEVT